MALTGIPRLGLDRLTAAAMALAAFTIGSIPPTDFDYWWHLAVGRYMVQTHRWPSPDPFSFTASGQTWTAHEWLIEIIMYGLYSAVGHSGPRAFFAACFAITMLVVFLALRRAGIRVSIATALALLLMLACAGFAGPRPHLLSLLMFAMTWATIGRWLERRDRTVWLLPLLFLVWANLHAGFWPGLALPMLVFAGDALGRFGWRDFEGLGTSDRRRLLLALALSIAAVFVNPNGWRVPAYPFTAIGRPEVEAISEWMPANIHSYVTWPFFGICALYLVIVILRRPRLPAFDLLTVGLFVVGGLWTVRVVPFAAIALTMLIARAMVFPHESVLRGPLVPRSAPSVSPAPARGLEPPRWLEIVGLLPLVLAAFAVLIGYRQGFEAPGGRQVPERAVAALGAQGLPTPLLNDYNSGGYLIWALWPEQKVFVDGRSHDLYTHGPLFEDYLAMHEVSPKVDSLLEQYAIQTVLFPSDAVLPRYLLATGAWETTYEDDQTIVLRRR